MNKKIKNLKQLWHKPAGTPAAKAAETAAAFLLDTLGSAVLPLPFFTFIKKQNFECPVDRRKPL